MKTSLKKTKLSLFALFVAAAFAGAFGASAQEHTVPANTGSETAGSIAANNAPSGAVPVTTTTTVPVQTAQNTGSELGPMTAQLPQGSQVALQGQAGENMPSMAGNINMPSLTQNAEMGSSSSSSMPYGIPLPPQLTSSNNCNDLVNWVKGFLAGLSYNKLRVM